MNFKWWLKYTIKVLLTPGCWIRIKSTSKAWDMQFLKLLEENKWTIKDVDMNTAYIGKKKIWIENHPYASFLPQLPVRLLPSRKTALYAMDRLEQDLLEATK